MRRWFEPQCFTRFQLCEKLHILISVEATTVRVGRFSHTHARVCMYVYVGFSWGLSNDMIFIQEILFKRCAQYKHHRYKLERKVITKGLETTYSVTKSVLNLVPALC